MNSIQIPISSRIEKRQKPCQLQPCFNKPKLELRTCTTWGCWLIRVVVNSSAAGRGIKWAGKDLRCLKSLVQEGKDCRQLWHLWVNGASAFALALVKAYYALVWAARGRTWLIRWEETSLTFVKQDGVFSGSSFIAMGSLDAGFVRNWADLLGAAEYAR
jgi:hypothetical protein